MKAPENSDRKSSPPTGSIGRRIRFILPILCICFVGWRVKKLFDPPQDLSSSISATQASEDSTVTNSIAATNSQSLLLRIDQILIDAADHPFDPLLEIAEASLAKTDQYVTDYTTTLVSQVQLQGKLQPERKLFCKIRHARTGNEPCGLAVYTRFLTPKSSAGQEAIWVDGQNDGALVAHATGLLNIRRVYLQPTSSFAMSGSRYPITEIGLRTLLVKMMETGRRDRQHDDCEVIVKRDLEIDGRRCVMLEVKHVAQQDYFDFHIARIYIDNDLEIPLAYEGYSWPTSPDGAPVLLEKYFYTDLKVNVGLTDADFDPSNEDYTFPAK